MGKQIVQKTEIYARWPLVKKLKLGNAVSRRRSIRWFNPLLSEESHYTGLKSRPSLSLSRPGEGNQNETWLFLDDVIRS